MHLTLSPLASSRAVLTFYLGSFPRALQATASPINLWRHLGRIFTDSKTLRGFPTTYVSNYRNEIKKLSRPLASFQRIRYYLSSNRARDCLRLKARDANTDSTYTHIHWAFAGIDPTTWKPVIEDGKDEWADFKALRNVKRIVSLGGWAYSTEPDTYHIIRSAIINNRNTFATNIADFAKNEGINGIDID